VTNWRGKRYKGKKSINSLNEATLLFLDAIVLVTRKEVNSGMLKLFLTRIAKDGAAHTFQI